MDIYNDCDLDTLDIKEGRPTIYKYLNKQGYYIMRNVIYHIRGSSKLILDANQGRRWHEFAVPQQYIHHKTNCFTLKEKADRFESSIYKSDEGWDGIPSNMFRMMLISSCKLMGFKTTLAKMSIFEVPDGRDALCPTLGLTRIIKGVAEYFESICRTDYCRPYIYIQACYSAGWEAKVKLRFDSEQFTVSDITNLLARAGCCVGSGWGRPETNTGAGHVYGTFDIVQKIIQKKAA